MILSMTGYAAIEQQLESGALTIEIRSVNHRYLELQLKLDDALRGLESSIREQISSKLSRGKVDCRISVHRHDDAVATGLNHATLQKIATDVQTIAQFFPEAQPINLLEVLRVPGVQTAETLDAEKLAAQISTNLDIVLADLIQAKAREGEKLKSILLARLADIEQQILLVRPRMPDLINAYREKLVAKLNEALGEADDERVRQEMVLYAQRIDVDEELGRLVAHASEVKRILGHGGSAGKRLDFLMQEMNREANTLGSKSVSIETSKVSMELKVLIEQMREQIQNIE